MSLGQKPEDAYCFVVDFCDLDLSIGLKRLLFLKGGGKEEGVPVTKRACEETVTGVTSPGGCSPEKGLPPTGKGQALSC